MTTPALIPVPVSCVSGNGAGVRLDADCPIIAGTGTRPEAEVLARQLAAVFGRAPQVVDGEGMATGAAIVLRRADLPEAGDEGYRLAIGPTGAEISAAAPAGLFYGGQALLQLLPPNAPAGAEIAPVCIEDRPRFSWRGAMLDPARHMLPVDDVLRFIDAMARYRLNRLHLHLTDDQGWRMEILRYPELTRVGAWRRESMAAHANVRPHRFDGKPHGGFYTQADLRRIVAFAAERHITVVPEIEMPGHAQAAIAAYPWLGVDGRPCEVRTEWGVNPHILNAEERTIRFMQDVLEEVLAVFPSPWIHIGGDEAAKDEWKADARIQERIRALGVGDEHGLQAWIIARMDAFLTARGRRILGWDEILEGGLSPNATVVSWRGFTGGIDAARQGHDVIMASNSHTYFDHRQHEDTVCQPLAIGGMLTLERVYAFEPVPDVLTPEQGRRILGSQGQLWGEYIPDAAHLERMAFPRLCALAEVLWSPRETRDWSGFRARLASHLPRLDAIGVRYFTPPAPGTISVRPREADRPALIVLAAGMGSRFGGDKQVANVGPRDETILDFTAYDARRAGFAEVVLVVRPENRQLVHDLVGHRIARVMPVRYAVQDIAEPLPGVRATGGRSKPWGTAHALACALRGLERPCGVVNADDWYSPAGITALARLLARADATGQLITYPLGRTLSANGPVNRAVCATNQWNVLTAIEETTGIIGAGDRAEVRAKDGRVERVLPLDTPVSLNLWGFQPAFYAPFIADVEAWIGAHLHETGGECMLPLVAMEGCSRHGWEIRCDLAHADWTGLTYQADRPAVQQRLREATAAGDYPAPLWD